VSAIEVSEIRRRLRGALDKARHAAEDRRARTDAAARDYEAFLAGRAVPVFQQFALALNGEGHPFKVFTPASSVRLTSDRSAEEFVELTLDDTSDPPAVVGRTTRGRGRRMVTSERAIRDGAPIAELTEEDVVSFLLEEVVGLVAR
jgi:hypothetical protein